jgi:subtilisin family serine protease
MNLSRTRIQQTVCASLALACLSPAVAAAATDPLLAEQWALANPAMIGAPEAWTQSSGDGVLVAVLDTGVQLDHPDLAGAIWTNTGEVPGNGRDDDADGFVDDVHGANMLDGSPNVADDNGHGTHVAGIIAARQGNGIGGSGVAPDATILPVKVLDANMAGTTDALARGIVYAVDRGAKILNTSVNGDTATDSVRAAVRYAGQHGAIIVASAGNNGRNIDLLPSYVASLTDPAIITVGALSSNGHLWNASNTGLLSVDLAAPGEKIVSTGSQSSYQARTGTSAAAPFVSGSLALLAGARPGLGMSVLRSAIIDTARRSDLLATLLGGGQLDVGAAMHSVVPGAMWKTAPPAGPAVATLRLRSKARVRTGSRATVRWSAVGAGGVTRWRVSLDGRVVARVSATVAGVSRRMQRAGRHVWRVVGLDAAAAKVVSARRAFRVAAPRRG